MLIIIMTLVKDGRLRVHDDRTGRVLADRGRDLWTLPTDIFTNRR
jgi:hypothetical protein